MMSRQPNGCSPRRAVLCADAQRRECHWHDACGLCWQKRRTALHGAPPSGDKTGNPASGRDTRRLTSHGSFFPHRRESDHGRALARGSGCPWRRERARCATTPAWPYSCCVTSKRTLQLSNPVSERTERDLDFVMGVNDEGTYFRLQARRCRICARHSGMPALRRDALKRRSTRGSIRVRHEPRKRPLMQLGRWKCAGPTCSRHHCVACLRNRWFVATKVASR